MPSLKFPDTGTRMVVLPSGKPAVDATGFLYADGDSADPAEAYVDVDNVKGAAIPLDSQGRRAITLDGYGEQPDYWGPTNGTRRLWLEVNGVRSPVDADYKAQIEGVAASVAGLDAAVTAKVDEDVLGIRVAKHGILPNGVDQTAALQALINTLPATGGPALIFEAGRYQVGAIDLGERSIELIGVAPNFALVNKFGNGNWQNSSLFRGTWLVSSTTTGSALTIGAAGGYALDYKYKLTNIGIVGPGTGTSTGVLINNSVHVVFDQVHIANFSTGLIGDFVQSGRFTDLAVWGCQTGIYLDHYSNQNLFINLDLQWNSTYALRMEETDTNLFVAGVTECNNGTPIYLGSLCRKATFEGWYFEDLHADPAPGGATFWPTPVTWVVDSPGSENTFRDCHFKIHASECGDIRFSGNSNALINPYDGPDITLSGIANMLIGTFYSNVITEPVPGTNAIVSYFRNSLTSDLNLPAGKRLYLGAVSQAAGAGSPEGAVAATPGSQFVRSDGNGLGKVLYLKTGGSGNTGWMAAGGATPNLGSAFTAGGEASFDRHLLAAPGTTLTSGAMDLCYFVATQTETITSLSLFTATTAAATVTLIRYCVFGVAANGDLTLVAGTASDTSLLAAPGAAYPKVLSASWSKVAGQRYAVGLLVLATTMPSMASFDATSSSVFDAIYATEPRLSGRVTGLSDLPSSVAAGTVAITRRVPYVEMH